MSSKKFPILSLISFIPGIPALLPAADWGGVDITTSSSSGFPIVTLENSVFKLVIRVNPGGGDCGNEHAIRDLIIKSVNQDQVDAYLDACAQRGPLKKAEVVTDGPDEIKVKLEYRDCSDTIIQAVSYLTIFKDSPVIKVDYEKYPGWTNTVEIGTPGGLQGQYQAVTRIYGQENYIRGLQYHEDSYWNTFDGGAYANDPADGGALNYHGHMIMAVGNPETGVGFGRIMPIKSPGKGGIKILKLLWDRGFESFPATGQSERPAFTGYLYVFTGGLEDAIERGKRIVDGYLLSTSEHPDLNYGYPVIDARFIDTGEFLGWLDIALAPWVWSFGLDSWLFLSTNPDTDMSAQPGIWFYLPDGQRQS